MWPTGPGGFLRIMAHLYPASDLWEETQSEGGAIMPPELGLGICETDAMYRPRHPEEENSGHPFSLRLFLGTFARFTVSNDRSYSKR